MDISITRGITAPTTPLTTRPTAPRSEAPAPPQAPAGDGVTLSRVAAAPPPPATPTTPAPAARPAAPPPTVLTMDDVPPPVAAAGPNLLARIMSPEAARLAPMLSLDAPRAEVAARLAGLSGVDAADKTKGPMLANYADLVVKTQGLGLSADSVQMRVLEKVLVANLKDEQAAANATHVWNVGDGAVDIGRLLNQGATPDKKLSAQELGNRVVAAMLHDPPNKKPFGPSFLLHNKFAANRADKLFTDLKKDPAFAADGKSLDEMSSMAQRRALDHHVAPSWMAYTTVAEAAKSLPSLQSQLAGLPDSEKRPRLDALNGILMDAILNKGVDPAVGLPSPEQLQKSFTEKNIPITREEASTLASLSGKLLDPIHAEQLPPDADHPTCRVKFDAREQALLDGINTAYRAEALSAGQMPEDVGAHFDWYAPPNVDQFPHARGEQEAALHMIAADGLANYAKADAFLVKAPDGSATPGKFLGFYTAQGPEVAYKSAQSDKPGGSYFSYRTFLGDMPAVAKVAEQEHGRTAGMVDQTLQGLRTDFPAGYLSLDPKSSFEPWRAPGQGDKAARDRWVRDNAGQVLPQANAWRQANGMDALSADGVKHDDELLGKAVSAYQSAYADAFATRLNELDKATPKVGG